VLRCRSILNVLTLRVEQDREVAVATLEAIADAKHFKFQWTDLRKSA
jgi:hypothetical protein